MSVRRVIVDHVLFVVPDLDASRRLYTAALAPLGYEELYVQEDCVSYGAEDLDDFTICQGEPVTAAAHVAFSAEAEAIDPSVTSPLCAPKAAKTSSFSRAGTPK
jgi:catechol 2,3-dioxygenase-like lactoylglutathione lyase family enzyme